MKKGKYLYFAIIGFMLILFIYGCIAYGKLSLDPGRPEKMTIQKLQENWDDYSIHYADWRTAGWPGGIIFDPKQDAKTLRAEKWTKIEDQETLSRVVSSIQTKSYSPELYSILGPNDEFYGYMYLGPNRNKVNYFIKVIDSNSLWVSDLQPRTLGR